MRLIKIAPIFAVLALAACDNTADQTGSTTAAPPATTTTTAPPATTTAPPPAATTTAPPVAPGAAPMGGTAPRP